METVSLSRAGSRVHRTYVEVLVVAIAGAGTVAILMATAVHPRPVQAAHPVQLAAPGRPPVIGILGVTGRYLNRERASGVDSGEVDGREVGMSHPGEQRGLPAQDRQRGLAAGVRRGVEEFQGELGRVGAGFGVVDPAGPVDRGGGTVPELLEQLETADGLRLLTAHAACVGRPCPRMKPAITPSPGGTEMPCPSGPVPS